MRLVSRIIEMNIQLSSPREKSLHGNGTMAKRAALNRVPKITFAGDSAMPNPFPGMDPYLEGPLWTTVRTSLVNEISRQLAPKLRPKHFASPGA